MATVTGAQALVRQLIAEGVDTIFALPGVQIMAAFDAFYEYRDDIRLVHVRHEQATTYMADGYAKATGKVGVAMAVPRTRRNQRRLWTWYGVRYIYAGPAYLRPDRQRHSLGRREGQLHEVEDQLDVFRPLTKWVHRVTRVDEIPGAVHEAFRQLKTGQAKTGRARDSPGYACGNGRGRDDPR